MYANAKKLRKNASSVTLRRRLEEKKCVRLGVTRHGRKTIKKDRKKNARDCLLHFLSVEYHMEYCGYLWEQFAIFYEVF